MRNILLASVCAAGVLVSGAAMAQDANITGTVGGGYAGVINGGSGSDWNINGSAQTQLGGGWGVEGTANYDRTTPGSLDSFNFGGSLFTGMDFGRVAATVGYGGAGPIHDVQYGVGGDWYASDNFTVSLKGGGLSATAAGSSVDGGYFGGQATWYVAPNFALSGGIDYATASSLHVTTESVRAEWLFSDSLPLSVYGGYQHGETSGTSADALFIGLKFYFDGASSLVGHQRTGSLGYISQSAGL